MAYKHIMVYQHLYENWHDPTLQHIKLGPVSGAPTTYQPCIQPFYQLSNHAFSHLTNFPLTLWVTVHLTS
jgi:hypothetical protein